MEMILKQLVLDGSNLQVSLGVDLNRCARIDYFIVAARRV